MQQTFTDQMGRKVTLKDRPRKIISLVPSQTELLFELGLQKEITGITRFCVHPAAACSRVTRIGGTKKLQLELIRSLQPDLIIGNKEENNRQDIEVLEKEFPVWMSDVNDLEGALEAIGMIGELTDRQPEAAYLNHLISTGFADLQTLALQREISGRVAYLIWKDPWMLAGRDTFIADILEKNGLSLVTRESRYPEITLEALAALQPDHVFLSSEPFPFREKHITQLKAALPDAAVRLVDGEMFSWYGSRLVKAVGYFFELQQQLK